MDPTRILQILEDSEALLRGHFELRSGLHSDRFFQCANVLRFPDLAAQLCSEVVAAAKEGTGGLKADAVVSPALGGIIVGHEVARALGVPCVFAEKADGVLVMRRFAIEAGKRYVVAEDVITRGGRVQETIDIVEEAGGIVAGILLLVDRSGGKVVFPYPTYSLLRIEPVTYEPGNCPLCDQGVPLVHPGS